MKKLRLVWTFTVLILLIFVCKGYTNEFHEGFKKNVKRADYPDANYVVMKDDTSINLSSNGDYEEINIMFVHILTDKGKKSFEELSFFYNSRYQTFEDLQIGILYPDGKRSMIPPADIHDSATGYQDMNIYETSFRTKTVTLSDLPVGAVIGVYKKIKTHGLLPNHFIGSYTAQGEEPVVSFSLKLIAPQAFPIYSYVYDKRITHVEKTSGSSKIYLWEARNMPPVIAESYMPIGLGVPASVELTSFSSWEEASSYVYKLNKGKYELNDAMKKTLSELISGLKTDEEKILAVHKYIARKIRYMGSSMDSSFFLESHDAIYTFEKGYGICRDKALLMSALLRHAGIECNELLIDPSTETNPAHPTLFFEHAVCHVRAGDKYYVMDPTDENSVALGSDYAGDRYALPEMESGGTLIKIPPVSASQNNGNIKAKATFTKESQLEMTIEIKGTGGYEKKLRSLGKALSPEKLRRIFATNAARIASDAEVVDFSYTDPNNPDKDFVVNIDLKSPSYGIKAGQYYLVPMPFRKFDFDLLTFRYIINASLLKDRKYPLAFTEPISTSVFCSLEIPQGYKIRSLPGSLHIKDGPVSADLKYSAAGKTVTFKADYAIEKRMVSLSDYDKFKNSAEKMRKFGRKYIVLIKE